MRYTQHFFISGQLLGSSPRKPVFFDGKPRAPVSYLFHCEFCGDVYAKCPVVDEKGEVSLWLALRRVCVSCRGKKSFFSEWPGSITLDYDKEFSSSFPLKVLHRELLLHIDNLEKAFK